MKYEAPELDIIELDTNDIIQTSGEDDRSENDTPGLPLADQTY